MNFTPKSAEEIQLMNLMNPGIYSFEVTEAKERTSKGGNPMIELKLKIWDSSGREHYIFDYLLEAMSYKLRHFCDAVGLIDKYNLGSIDELDCLGKAGSVEIIRQIGQKKADGSSYPDKNAVKDYLKQEKSSSKKEEKKDEFIDDDVPF